MGNVRKYVSNFSVNLNLHSEDGIIAVSTRGALYPVARPPDRSVKSYCPTCGTKSPNTIRTAYFCTDHDDHGPFQPNEVLKGKEVEGTVVIVDRDELDRAKASSLDSNVLDLQVFDYGEVMERVYPNGSAYYFVPDRVDDPYKIIASSVTEYAGKFAFVGPVNLRNFEKLVALTPYGDGFIVQVLSYPEDLNNIEVPEVDIDRNIVKHIGDLVSGSISEFDPDDFRDLTRERLQQMLVEASGKKPRKKPAPKKKGDDIGGGLIAQIAAAKAKS